MDLFSIANSIITSVNDNEVVTIRRSSGAYTIDPLTRKQIPGYLADVTGPAQIQALDSDDLKHMDGLNIQGTLRAIYLRGSLAGVIRPDTKGGDLVFRNGMASEWLVVKVLETWPTWTKAVIVQQGGT